MRPGNLGAWYPTAWELDLGAIVVIDRSGFAREVIEEGEGVVVDITTTDHGRRLVFVVFATVDLQFLRADGRLASFEEVLRNEVGDWWENLRGWRLADEEGDDEGATA